MQAQQCSLQSINKAGGGKIYTKLCIRPIFGLSAIYSALGFKEISFVRKSKVVTPNVKIKLHIAVSQRFCFVYLQVGLSYFELISVQFT